MICPLAIQSERSSFVHNFETRDNLPFMNNAGIQSIPLFSKKNKTQFIKNKWQEMSNGLIILHEESPYLIHTTPWVASVAVTLTPGFDRW